MYVHEFTQRCRQRKQSPASTFVCMHMYICMCVCLYVCMCVCMYDIRMDQSMYVGKSICIQVYTTYAMVPSKEAVISQRPSGVYSTERHWYIYVYIYIYINTCDMTHSVAAFIGRVYNTQQHCSIYTYVHICISKHATCRMHCQRPSGVYSTERHWYKYTYVHIYISTQATCRMHWQRPSGVFSTQWHWYIINIHIHINTHDITHSLAASIGRVLHWAALTYISMYIHISIYAHTYQHTRHDAFIGTATLDSTHLLHCNTRHRLIGRARELHQHTIWQIHWHCNMRHDPFIALQHVVVIHTDICIYIYMYIHINTHDMTQLLALQHETRPIYCTATRGSATHSQSSTAACCSAINVSRRLIRRVALQQPSVAAQYMSREFAPE